MKFNVMYPNLLGRVSFWLNSSYSFPPADAQNETQWALEMKVLSSLPDRNLWQGSVAVFIDSGSSSVSCEVDLASSRCRVADFSFPA